MKRHALICVCKNNFKRHFSDDNLLQQIQVVGVFSFEKYKNFSVNCFHIFCLFYFQCLLFCLFIFVLSTKRQEIVKFVTKLLHRCVKKRVEKSYIKFGAFLHEFSLNFKEPEKFTKNLFERRRNNEKSHNLHYNKKKIKTSCPKHILTHTTST